MGSVGVFPFFSEADSALFQNCGAVRLWEKEHERKTCNAEKPVYTKNPEAEVLESNGARLEIVWIETYPFPECAAIKKPNRDPSPGLDSAHKVLCRYPQ